MGEEPISSPPNTSSAKGVLAFLIIAIIFAAGGVVTYKQIQQKNAQTTPGYTAFGEPTQAVEQKGIISSPISQHTLVYGTWTTEGSIIKYLDLSSGKNNTLASLPINIKKVSVLSPDKLLYIDKTDKRDYGSQLTVYTVSQNKGQLVLKAADGFGIDDYVVSPNKKYIATWEVLIPAGSASLTQGQSRVYTASLDKPSEKHLIYDESAKSPVHYPRAILDDGKIFLDTFLANDPNGGTGWAYGMSVSDFNGTSKQDLTQMAAGTYGTQPSLSPDGRMLVFAGYDGSSGPGTALKNGYRQAVLTPNTVETLDTTTLARQKIAQFSNINTYSGINWNDNNSIAVTTLSQTDQATGEYIFDLNTKLSKKIDFPPDNSNDFMTLIAPLSAEKVLIGTGDNSETTLGNLGDSYSGSFKQFSILDTKSSTMQVLNLQDNLMQNIAVLPSSYFPNSSSTNQSNSSSVENSASKDSLQLYAFFVKTDLGNVRAVQQASPRCRNFPVEQCSAKGLQMGTRAYAKCVNSVLPSARSHGACHDSPLYLYGPSGKKVDVTVNTPVSSSTPEYNKGYQTTLLDNGRFIVNDKTYTKIEYDYTSGIKKVLPPAYGTFVSQNEVSKVLANYASGLGLNTEETKDLLSAGKQSITTPYAFISFYDQKTSEAILPLSFNPKPDNYLNVVFYFKLLQNKPNFSPKAPTFGAPLNRSGFTAVEVSEIVE